MALMMLNFENIFKMAEKETMFKCDMCPKAYPSKASMVVHRKIHTNFITGDENANDKSDVRGAQLKCPECGVSLCSNQSLNYHLIAIHKYKSTEFRCSHCDMSFNMEQKLRYHISNRYHT